ncbi:MAG: translation initiation factor IF-2 N-terminal domain-containing protein, partial [Limisphaerales bacterium]
MPVRIYEIAKQLGIPNKEVIARAKELGISNAKVPSSSIDKITAEYLIKEMGGGDTQETPAQEAIVVVKDESETISDASSSSEDVPTEPTESEASEEGSIKVIHAEEPVETETPEDVPEETSSTESVGTSQEASSQSADTPDSQVETTQEVPQNTSDATPSTEPEASTSDEPSASPTLGAKIGFIQLPTKPAGASSRPGDHRKERDQKRKLKQREQDGPLTESAQPAAASTEPKPKPKFIQKYKIPEDGEQITLKPPIIIRDLAQLIRRKPFQLIADLMELNVFATVNQAIEEPVAKQVCAKHGFRFEVEKREKGAGFTKTEEAIKLDHRDKDEDLDSRPPV